MTKTARAKKSSPLATLMVGILLFSLGALWILLPRMVESKTLQTLEKITSLSAKISTFQFSLSKGRLIIKGLQLMNPAGFPEAALVSLSEVRGNFTPLSVLGGRLDLNRLELDFEDFRLMRNNLGVLNLTAMLQNLKEEGRIEEVVINLPSVTYTDLSGAQPVQNTFDLALNQAVYRNVKGISGILEIIHWEVVKRTGVEEEVKPIAESPVAEQSSPVPVLSALPESTPAPSEPSPAPSAPEAVAPS